VASRSTQYAERPHETLQQLTEHKAPQGQRQAHTRTGWPLCMHIMYMARGASTGTLSLATSQASQPDSRTNDTPQEPKTGSPVTNQKPCQDLLRT